MRKVQNHTLLPHSIQSFDCLFYSHFLCKRAISEYRSNVRTRPTLLKTFNSNKYEEIFKQPEYGCSIVAGFLRQQAEYGNTEAEPQPADTQEQASGAVQEKAGEAVPEQADGTPQVVRRISGKQRRASLEEYKEEFLRVPSIEDRKPYSSAAARVMPSTASSVCSASDG